MTNQKFSRPLRISITSSNHNSIFHYVKNQSHICDLLPQAEKVKNLGYLKEFKESISSYANNSGVQFSVSMYNFLIFDV
jgi:hypothetical protein